MTTRPFFVVEVHFPEAAKGLQAELYDRFGARIWCRLTSWFPKFIRMGVRCETIEEAVEIANEYGGARTMFRDGDDPRFVEVSVEGWEARPEKHAEAA